MSLLITDKQQYVERINRKTCHCGKQGFMMSCEQKALLKLTRRAKVPVSEQYRPHSTNSDALRPWTHTLHIHIHHTL